MITQLCGSYRRLLHELVYELSGLTVELGLIRFLHYYPPYLNLSAAALWGPSS
jgi:hypothetical protein